MTKKTAIIRIKTGKCRETLALPVFFLYNYIRSCENEKAVKWKVVDTRIAVVYMLSFSIEQVYTRL